MVPRHCEGRQARGNPWGLGKSAYARRQGGWIAAPLRGSQWRGSLQSPNSRQTSASARVGAKRRLMNNLG